MSRPNIVMLLTDHWRGDSLGRLGHPVAETPHLDELSAHGTTFTDAYTPCPSCIAARRSIMSGQVPDTHGMLGYRDGQPWEFDHTLAGELARAGYQTMNVGKTHFHPARCHLGFEQLIIPDDYNEWARAETDMVRPHNVQGVHGNSWMARPNMFPELKMQETWLTNESMKLLEKRDPTRPFFMSLSFNGPHPPWTPPAVYFDLFMDKDMPEPNVGEWAGPNADVRYPLDVNAWKGKLTPELNHRARAGYYAYLAYLDSQIGRFIEFLGRSGLKNNTLFLFSTDHGEMLGDHHLWRKTYAYDASARIPFIITPPASWDVARNELDARLVGLEDIMPTLLEAADVDAPDTVEGRSLIPLLKGEEPSWREWYHHEHSPCYAGDNAYQCLTGKKWKYIWNPINGDEQLFERSDNNERKDMSKEEDCLSVLEEWRLEMARHLAHRPEKLSDGKTLTPNEVPVWRNPRECEC